MSPIKTELNINECTETQQLTVLPGIGEKMAATILAEKSIRPFQSAADLMARVNGLSSKRISKMSRKFRLKFDVAHSVPKKISPAMKVSAAIVDLMEGEGNMSNQHARDKATMFDFLTNLMEYKFVTEQ